MMIHYHGLPMTPESAAATSLRAAHAFVSFTTPGQLATVLDCCQSFALDNGAFSAWSAGTPIQDWRPYYQWAADVLRYPACDFAVIPDVIEGDETANDRLVAEWPLPRHAGAPVWHLHESLGRLARLACDWPRVCLGSSGAYSRVGDERWHARMAEAMSVLCDTSGRPLTKLHGLRMLNPAVFTRYPFASTDSTNIARNIGIDKRWSGSYAPVGENDTKKGTRAIVIRARIEAFNSPPYWKADGEHLSH